MGQTKKLSSWPTKRLQREVRKDAACETGRCKKYLFSINLNQKSIFVELNRLTCLFETNKHAGFSELDASTKFFKAFLASSNLDLSAPSTT